MGKAEEIFRKEFETFESDSGIKEWTADILNSLPEYFWECAASSTGKHHNRFQNGEGGNVVHTKMNLAFANEMLQLEHWNSLFDVLTRDMIRSALLLHDGLKYGPNKAPFVLHEHPVLMAEYIRSEKWDDSIPEFIRSQVADMVARHSGQGVAARNSSTILPKPQTEAEFFVHLCDYLGSREHLMAEVDGVEIIGRKKDETIQPEEMQKAKQLIGNRRWNRKIYAGKYIYLDGERIEFDQSLKRSLNILAVG